MSITVEGVITEARPCVTGVDEATLVFTISTGSGDPFEARWTLGRTPEDHLRAGRIVGEIARHSAILVLASRVELRTDHGARTVVLRGVSMIQAGPLVLRA